MAVACGLCLFSRGSRVFLASGSLFICITVLQGNYEVSMAQAPSWIRCLALSDDESLLVVATNCKQVQLYQVDTLKLISSM